MIDSGFEKVVQNSLLNASAIEKTTIDKVLARQDADRVREIVRKTELTREDVSELRDLLASPEIKMLSYDEWKWYVQLKFYTWVTEIIKHAEMTYDYEYILLKKSNTCLHCEKEIKSKINTDLCQCAIKTSKVKISQNTETLLRNNRMIMQFCIKLMVETYLNIGRSSLSIGATGFLETLKNKFEMQYSGDNPNMPAPAVQQQKKKGIFGW